MMKCIPFGMAVLCAALVCALSFAAKKSANQLPDLAFIINTGSTNTTGYRVDVFSDGSCGIENSYTRAFLSITNALHPEAGHTGAFEPGKVPLSVARQFFRDIKASQPLARLPVRMGFKSVSFGTSTFVVYGDQRTPDLSSPADARGKALAADVKNIVATLGLTNLPRRTLGH